MGWRDALEPELEKSGGGERVGGVEAEIAGQCVPLLAVERSDEAGGTDQDRAIERSRKSTIRSSPGLRMRGLATRTEIPAALTRSTDGFRP